ncbi:MAG TPA: RNA polymerase sigma factor [Hyphomonas sp.]|nr:RNA polymerase sigma factor [Hyphomonas sp.]MCA8903629.1 RNA polymerase sigma factor [Hyphomonas sp.]MCB9962637.1 RNA polymerase sigma factor [Hyphomonas sp.]MCB9972918.1 RNA polymerase sigma factor [Hyphomonas sp.]HPE47413.1 RNA polymerase sigma factor [Hyphomonas sp.]
MAFTSDLDQITRAAAGDPSAAAWLVDRYSPGIIGLATRMLGDRTEAEDVTQETFLRAWKALPDWEPRAKFSTWLHRVALNLCYDILRKRREDLPGELPDLADPAPTPPEQLAQGERVRAIEAAIADLPERQAAAITLCALQGHSQAEAASIMETSEEALESLLARARRTLRTTLAERSVA